jgi:transposase InsO family protein
MDLKKQLLGKEQKYQQRIFVVRIAVNQGTQAAALKAGISERTVRSWKARFEEFGLEGLRSLSTRPKFVANKKDQDGVMSRAMVVLQETEPGLTHLQILFILLGENTIDLATLSWIARARKRLGLTKVKKEKTSKHKLRYEIPVPGFLQIDTKDVPASSRAIPENKLYQFTAIDECSRVRFLKGSPDKGSIAATKFLEDAVVFFTALGIKVVSAQTDNGTEYTLPRNDMTMASFARGETEEHIFTKKCTELGIRHKLIAPASPQLNGKVERSHRIDNDRFYSRFKFANEYELDHALKTKWLPEYNERRPHGGLKYQTPMEFLKQRLEKLEAEQNKKEKIIQIQIMTEEKKAA